MAGQAPTGEPGRLAIWDWPVRICHWLFALIIPLSWWTAEEQMFDWHFRLGILLLILLVFRLVWGFIGSSTARFSGFLAGPATAMRYLRGQWPKRTGHNPIGGWSVVALLLVMIVQVGLGLFASDDDGLDAGPLSHLVSIETSERITELHESAFDILLVLIVLHLAAILFYTFVKRQPIVPPMISGKGKAEAGMEPLRPASALSLIFALIAAFGFGWWINAGAPF